MKRRFVLIFAFLGPDLVKFLVNLWPGVSWEGSFRSRRSSRVCLFKPTAASSGILLDQYSSGFLSISLSLTAGSCKFPLLKALKMPFEIGFFIPQSLVRFNMKVLDSIWDFFCILIIILFFCSLNAKCFGMFLLMLESSIRFPPFVCLKGILAY